MKYRGNLVKEYVRLYKTRRVDKISEKIILCNVMLYIVSVRILIYQQGLVIEI